MKNLEFGRIMVSACVAAAMLAGCGGRAGGGVMPNNAAPNSFPNHKTFNYTGGAQHFKVPAGVTYLKVIARGAKGAGSPVAYGGRVHAVIPVTPEEKLVVYVGGDASGVSGGFNGGANGGETYYCRCSGYGGGGASDVRQGGHGLGNRVLVAGGGGGQGGGDDAIRGGAPGKGGGATGGSGGTGGGDCAGSEGAGGAQTAGGSGGSGGPGTGDECAGYGGESGANGTVGSGGGGGEGFSAFEGGGGGGGYYGGGGGGSGDRYYASGSGYTSGGGGGGGGGSSYAERSATNVRFWQGWKQSAGNGLLVISW